MSSLFSSRRVAFFLGGFIVGKLVGVNVSLIPYWGLFLEDGAFRVILVEEFMFQLLQPNIYHLALGVSVGLILTLLRGDHREASLPEDR